MSLSSVCMHDVSYYFVQKVVLAGYIDKLVCSNTIRADKKWNQKLRRIYNFSLADFLQYRWK